MSNFCLAPEYPDCDCEDTPEFTQLSIVDVEIESYAEQAYGWELDKTVASPEYVLYNVDSANVCYTITATKLGAGPLRAASAGRSSCATAAWCVRFASSISTWRSAAKTLT